MSFQSKDSQVLNRQLKVQRVVIPLSITGNAVPASVVARNDEPSLLFLRTEGIDQITAALAAGETATYSSAPNDANGVFNILLKVGEPVAKVCAALSVRRATGILDPVQLGDADGLSSAGNIMLTIDSTVDLSAANLDSCLIVEYIVAE